jgi:YgiT-type zinc finger domain-containing protein
MEEHVTQRRGRKVIVPELEIHRCARCGEAFLTDEAMRHIEEVARKRTAA